MVQTDERIVMGDWYYGWVDETGERPAYFDTAGEALEGLKQFISEFKEKFKDRTIAKVHNVSELEFEYCLNEQENLALAVLNVDAFITSLKLRSQAAREDAYMEIWDMFEDGESDDIFYDEGTTYIKFCTKYAQAS